MTRVEIIKLGITAASMGKPRNLLEVPEYLTTLSTPKSKKEINIWRNWYRGYDLFSEAKKFVTI